MKNVCIFGWYGTETLGDRAILDGIFQIFDSIGNFKINIGSLYPEFTKRTFLEDGEIYKKNSPKLDFDIFDVRNNSKTKEYIKNSDIIIMGGGPIMDLNELDIVRKAFIKAKKWHKKTILFGCGVGPLNQEKYIKMTKDILKNSDLCIFRDKNSCISAKKIYENGNYFYNYDPAILSILKYLKNENSNKSKDYICINFRMISSEYGIENKFDKFFLDIIQYATNQYEKVLLVPMHTFFVGGDDRKILTKLNNKVNQSNVSVIHKPMNIYELYNVYHKASACIGMRYHSIVMQTILNGNNVIIDYTNKYNGKVISFIDEIDKDKFYENRYINIKNFDGNLDSILSTLKEKNTFKFNSKVYEESLEFYKNKIEELFNETK